MKLFLILPLILSLGLSMGKKAENYKPIVLWHGMGDSCCNPLSLGRLIKTIKKELPGVYVLSIKIGDNIISDMENSYFMPVSKQLDQVCNDIKSAPQLKDGFNAIGFSQGGQFLRALVQKCPEPSMKNLISIGGQHQGVYGLPSCLGLKHKTCNYIRRLLNHAAYTSWTQQFLVQASYWHDPLNEEKYRDNSIFLAEINNEKTINQEFIRNLQTLNKMVLVKFENDTMVQPIDSEWFGWYKPGQDQEVLKMEETYLYKEDRLGLKKMVQDHKIDFLSLPTNHLEFDDEWFINAIINKYLK